MTEQQTAAGQSPITWGPEWPCEGERPAWLEPDTQVMVRSGTGHWYGDRTTWHAREIAYDCTAIRLPSSHWANTVLAYNAAHPEEQPFVPWSGGEEAPADWDGGEVLWDNPEGYTKAGSKLPQQSWQHGQSGWFDIVGYRPCLSKPEAAGEEDAPIDMILYCPKCGLQHVDEATEGWDNPPHRSHLCHGCGCVWRPADVATNGVAAIRTKGTKDNYTPSTSVTIERMSEETALQLLASISHHRHGNDPYGMTILRHLNLIAEPETRLDRYARENGLSEETKAAIAKWEEGK